MIPAVLSIAGSDPGGGAGIQADLTTFAAFGVHGCAAITALTAQTAREVRAMHTVAAEIVREQLEAALDAADVRAVKTGMLGDAAIVSAVAAALRARGPAVLVVDPVLRASAGATLLTAGGLAALARDLLPLATIVTPNAQEAGVLLGRPAPADLETARGAARALCGLGPAWALVTGGHIDAGDDCVDVLSDGCSIHEFSVRRGAGRGTHGTGCRLSAAIAALLALGSDVPAACAEAQRYVASTIAAVPQEVG